jgi:hypothetical protein
MPMLLPLAVDHVGSTVLQMSEETAYHMRCRILQEDEGEVKEKGCRISFFFRMPEWQEGHLPTIRPGGWKVSSLGDQLQLGSCCNYCFTFKSVLGILLMNT